MKTKSRLSALALALVLGISSAANAAPTAVTNIGGEYIGFDNISVGASVFNVRFKDGTFNGLFGGVPQFALESQAAAASLSLLLAIEGVGALDANPSSMFGCGVASIACFIMTSDAELSVLPNDVDVVQVRNGLESDNVLNGLQGELFPASFDTSVDNIGPGGASSYVWADWTAATTNVPEPSSIALLGAGLFAAVWNRRSRTRTPKKDINLA